MVGGLCVDFAGRPVDGYNFGAFIRSGENMGILPGFKMGSPYKRLSLCIIYPLT